MHCSLTVCRWALPNLRLKILPLYFCIKWGMQTGRYLNCSFRSQLLTEKFGLLKEKFNPKSNISLYYYLFSYFLDHSGVNYRVVKRAARCSLSQLHNAVAVLLPSTKITSDNLTMHLKKKWTSNAFENTTVSRNHDPVKVIHRSSQLTWPGVKSRH